MVYFPADTPLAASRSSCEYNTWEVQDTGGKQTWRGQESGKTSSVVKIYNSFQSWHCCFSYSFITVFSSDLFIVQVTRQSCLFEPNTNETLIWIFISPPLSFTSKRIHPVSGCEQHSVSPRDILIGSTVPRFMGHPSRDRRCPEITMEDNQFAIVICIALQWYSSVGKRMYYYTSCYCPVNTLDCPRKTPPTFQRS